MPSLFFTASGRPPAEELARFTAEVLASDLPGAELFRGVTPMTWDAALRLLATAIPQDRPSVIVLDELPYLVAADPAFEGTLQRAFDRELSRRPVLLVGIGSDLSMMEALNEYGRPFHQRATEMVLPAFNPLELAELLDLEAEDAFDAYLVTGGLPLILRDWPDQAGVFDFLPRALGDPTSALLVSGERALAAEFPPDGQARLVLSAIGSGERRFAAIGRAAGGLTAASLNRSLTLLVRKRIILAERPLSTVVSKETRYRVADPYLRFWLAFLGSGLPDIERGRGDRVLARIRHSWTSWRGRTVEPVIRESLLRMPVADLPAGAIQFGSYWTRTNDVEIDLVGTDRSPVAGSIAAVGSVKWLENATFDAHDLARLAAASQRLPGATPETILFAVSRSGSTVPGLPVYGPAELLQAWREGPPGP